MFESLPTPDVVLKEYRCLFVDLRSVHTQEQHAIDEECILDPVVPEVDHLLPVLSRILVPDTRPGSRAVPSLPVVEGWGSRIAGTRF